MAPSVLAPLSLLLHLTAVHAVAWPQTPTRTTRSLDGVWEFAWLGTALDVDSFSPTGVPTPARMTVPGAWDLSTLPGPGGVSLNGAHGSALYRTRLYVTPESAGRIHFAACGFWCAVYVDGALAATHGGQQYTAFWVGGIPPSASPWRTVEVLVDNRFNATRAPLLAYDFDWALYSGLFRSVTWHELPPASLLRADVLVRDSVAGVVDVRLRLHDLTETTWWRPTDVAAIATTGLAPRYSGFGPASLPRLPSWVNVSLAWDLDGPSGGEMAVAIDAHGAGVIPGLRVPNATLWSPASPALHLLHISLGETSLGPAPPTRDSLIERFGLRDVSVCPGAAGAARVCVNGAPVTLLGYGRHDTGPHFGHAIPDFQRQLDVAAAAGLGSNYLRLGHYTQAPAVAALCDEVGVMNGVEVIGWDSDPDTYSNPLWIGAGLYALEEMVNDTFNHPSTLTYAYINEGRSDVAGVCDTWAKFDRRYKSLSVQGLTTYANDHGTSDVCFGPSGADLMGLNTYPAWYSAAPVDPNLGWTWESQVPFVSATLSTFSEWMRSTHPGKPYYVSELGAGSIPGWHDQIGGYWTETYAARILDAGARAVVADGNWSGIAIWQLMDQRTYNGPGSLQRPRAFNNKGTFDENRKPKPQVWESVYSAFNGLPQPAWMAPGALIPG